MRSCYFPLILLYLVFACEAPVRTSLDKAEAVLKTNPDSALTIIERVYPGSIERKSLKNRAILLTASAMDRCGINDGAFLEETADAIDYYRRKGHGEEYLKALYYYSDQLKDAGQPEEAAWYLLKTIREAKRQKDNYFLGLSYRSSASIHGKFHDHLKEYRYAEMAYKCFDDGSLPRLADNAKLMAIKGLCGYSDYDKALSEVGNLIRDGALAKDTSLIIQALSLSLDPCLASDPPKLDEARKYAEKLLSLGGLNARQLAKCAQVFSITGNPEQAKVLLDSASNKQNDKAADRYVNSIAYLIAKEKGDTEKAIGLLEQKSKADEAELKESRKESAIYLNRMIKSKEESERESALIEKKTRGTYGKAAILSIILTTVLVLLERRRDNVEAQRLGDLFRQERKHSEELEAALTGTVADNRDVMAVGLDVVNDLSKTYLSGARREDLEATFESSLNRYRPGSESFPDFMMTVDNANAGILSMIRQEFKSLSDEDLTLAAYLLSGLSYSSISLLTGTDKQVLYNRVSRLRDRLSGIRGWHKDLITRSFSRRKQA